MAENFEKTVAELLKSEGFSFRREPAINGVRLDFSVEGPKGQFALIEVKDWRARGGNTARALEQAEHYRKLTKTDHIYIVLPHLKREFESRGVFGPETLISSLRTLFRQLPQLMKDVLRPQAEQRRLSLPPCHLIADTMIPISWQWPMPQRRPAWHACELIRRNSPVISSRR